MDDVVVEEMVLEWPLVVVKVTPTGVMVIRKVIIGKSNIGIKELVSEGAVIVREVGVGGRCGRPRSSCWKAVWSSEKLTLQSSVVIQEVGIGKQHGHLTRWHLIHHDRPIRRH